ncbi:MAG TPA: sigma-70 family RNA polymerase sigma factor [Polyangiales bacterium]|nr:sigma-70 family RNA polymerase sigma factor [Polyangiales bacterium]
MDIDLWYQRYGESVHRRCLRLCRNEQQALDLVQEVFLRAHRYRETFRGEASPLTWLFTLADRCFFDTLGEPVRAHAEGDELDHVPNEELESFEESFVSQDLIVRLLSRSDDEVRAIVVHRYFDELDLDAIAERLGLNERTVRRKLLRFLKGARKLAEARS